MEQYRDKYQIKSNRLSYWDYSGDGFYFITIVTQCRICNLAKIENGEIILSDFGKIIEAEWYESFEIRRELILDEFMIMPNHLHAIIIMNKIKCLDESQRLKSQFIRKPKSISSFIGGYKSVINSKVDDYIDENQLDIPKYNKKNHFFQPNYHDHVIRNDDEYIRVKNYMINNHLNWDNDKIYDKKWASWDVT